MSRSLFPPTDHLDDVLPDLVLGRAFTVAEQSHAADCARCADRFTQLRKRVTTSVRMAESVTSLASLLAHMLAELEVTGDLQHFAPEVAALLDLPDDAAWTLLEAVEDPSARWEPGPSADIEVLPLRSGSRWRGTRCVAIRARAGARHPTHTHLGHEHQIVVQGAFRDDHGTEVWRGERHFDAQGTTHEVTALPGPDCIVIARIEPPI